MDESKAVTRANGSYLVTGWLPVGEFADMLSIKIDQERYYEPVAGLVLDKVRNCRLLVKRCTCNDLSSKFSA